MNEFVKDEAAQKVPVMEYIKRDDPFMHLKTGAWGSTWDLVVGRQAMVAARAIGGLPFSKQAAQNTKGKEKPKRKGKREEGSFQGEEEGGGTSNEGVPSKKVMASATESAKETKLWSLGFLP